MKITSKKTGHTFYLSKKEAADFFYTKNARGQYINTSEDYTIESEDNISNFKFYTNIVLLFALGYASLYLYLQFNY
tara:strand:+ start:430 stop:657 length:228 start_codon:yes stop_codon:yes gene_type:complete